MKKILCSTLLLCLSWAPVTTAQSTPNPAPVKPTLMGTWYPDLSNKEIILVFDKAGTINPMALK
jgi:hypothetical protein